MRSSFRKLGLALGVVVLACSGGEITAPASQSSGSNTPASVIIAPLASPDIVIGTAVSLTISVRNASGQDLDLPITWVSSDATVANVAPSGVVTGMKLGTAIITGTVSGKSAAVTINVKSVGPLPVSRVTVSLLGTLAVGDSYTASYAAFDASGTPLSGRLVSWKSRDASIARVSATGVVTAVSVGSTTIDADVEGVVASAPVTVSSQGLIIGAIQVSMPDSSAVIAGKTVQATATVTDNVGNTVIGSVIAWTSSNPAVATVSPTGLITSVSSGTALVTATTGGKSGFALFRVAIPNAPVASVAVAAPRTTLFPTVQTQATVVTRDAAGAVLTGRVTTWTSACPSIATVSATGVITAVSLGSCVITATSEGITGTLTVQVVATPIGSLSIATTATNIPVGITTQLAAVLLDSLGAPMTRPTTWVSASPAIATISATGLVTGVAAGTSVVTATSAGLTANVTITVASPLLPPVATVTVTTPSAVMQPTQGVQATVVTMDASGNVLTGRVINWSSSNNVVASVSPLGFITPHVSGTDTITAVSEGKTGAVIITVPPVATVAVASPLSTLQPTQTTQATATLLDASARPALNRTVVWSSASPAVATVSTSGMITAVAGGTAVITATSEGVAGSKTISVPAVATVTVTGANLSPIPQQTTQLTATLLDASASPALNRTTVWTSSAPSVAFVSPTGLVTALSVGTAVITATSETKSGNVTILVTQPTVASIQITSKYPSLLLGQVSQLSTVILDNSGKPTTSITPTWTSSSPATATISPTGLITAVSSGTGANVTFTAAVGNVTASTTVTITGHGAETLAALPQVYLNTTMPAAPAAGGTVISVAAGGNLQAALNSAQPGDVIELANGASFAGNFTLPNKNTTSTKWIVIRPANMSGVPLEGNRMTPSQAAAAQLPIISGINNQGALQTDPGAHHYRLIGLEVTVPATIANTGLIRFGTGYETSLSALPHDLVLDRMYIHGTTTGTLRRAVVLNSASSSVIDSYISDCHEHGFDSQAIAGWGGSGPFKIVNNYLEAASENLSFGGADPMIQGLVPADIEIRHNHFAKQTSWKGQNWLVKNLFELKNAQRVLVEGNLFENNWQDAQGGSAINLKSVNQGGNCLWCQTRDVTFRLNLIRNTGSGIVMTGYDPQPLGLPISMARITITDNVISGIDTGIFDGDGRGFLFNNNPVDITIAHNTVFDPTNTAITFGGPATEPTVRLSFRDNIVGGGQYGVKGPGMSTAQTLAAFMPTGGFAANVLTLTGSNTIGFPTGTYFASSISTVGFASPSMPDFHLMASSPFAAKGTDMQNPGANIDALNAAIAGVVVP
jgi:trimeric autotransporter adhesin